MVVLREIDAEHAFPAEFVDLRLIHHHTLAADQRDIPSGQIVFGPGRPQRLFDVRGARRIVDSAVQINKRELHLLHHIPKLNRHTERAVCNLIAQAVHHARLSAQRIDGRRDQRGVHPGTDYKKVQVAAGPFHLRAGAHDAVKLKQRFIGDDAFNRGVRAVNFLCGFYVFADIPLILICFCNGQNAQLWLFVFIKFTHMTPPEMRGKRTVLRFFSFF